MGGLQLSLLSLYWRLFHHFGGQEWWPADSPFEVVIGAILTQNTAWTNVEQAISALKGAQLIDPERLLITPAPKVESLIRPTGYFRQKAQRLKGFSQVLIEDFEGDLGRMLGGPLLKTRQTLLSIRGLGPETADSVLLYAGGRPIFVIDAYTKRILHRLGLTESEKYRDLQKLFERNLPADVPLYQEYHALFVAQGKEYCRKVPRCSPCPIGGACADRVLAKV